MDKDTLLTMKNNRKKGEIIISKELNDKILNASRGILDITSNIDDKLKAKVLDVFVSSLIMCCSDNFDNAISVVNKIKSTIINTEKRINVLQDKEFYEVK